MMIRANGRFKAYVDRFPENRAIVYSMWSGYLKGKTANANTIDFLQPYDFISLHTSGHATTDALARLYETVNPTSGLIPMHTGAPEAFGELVSDGKIIYLNDGEKLNIGGEKNEA